MPLSVTLIDQLGQPSGAWSARRYRPAATPRLAGSSGEGGRARAPAGSIPSPRPTPVLPFTRLTHPDHAGLQGGRVPLPDPASRHRRLPPHPASPSLCSPPAHTDSHLLKQRHCPTGGGFLPYLSAEPIGSIGRCAWTGRGDDHRMSCRAPLPVSGGG